MLLLKKMKMKKLILLLITVISFVACEGPMGPEGPAGPSVLWKYADPEVYPNQWRLETDADGLNAHYACTIPVSALDWDMYDQGLIKLYVYLDPNDTDLGMIEMPDVYPYQDITTFEDYTVICGAILQEGKITFTVRYTDFANDVIPPFMKFHVVLIF